MSKFLVAVAMVAGVAGVAGTAHAADGSTSVGRDAGVKPVCERTDNAGFCMVDATRSHRAPTLTRVSLNDQGRMQLDRLIARLR